jgi:hypothetical protein
MISARVINLSDYRKPAADAVSSLHIEITEAGKVTTQPLQITQVNAMAMLKILVAICAHLIEVQGGRA